ncbi:50S ribosomal protein L32 [Wolbachia endosymbiont of Folsomia candida]|uniref:50S ribosomal protein L32 n=1 Tax=Wolbachia endosymbiont of Folsomia candida TaxID=169402 RepID=UPI000B021A49|nr:50S ribosomal protein L32 [Wolbachia endosymbiont of Folsomia candida]APR98501.1 50S ribosomal protein L32 [Wolbachia endosymbiont of Folsomia candida]
MAVPKRKKSKSRRNMHRSHHAIKPKNIVLNGITGEFMLPHCIDVAGYYKKNKDGKAMKVITTLAAE